MPTPGLALIGFMDERFASGYLQSRCIPANRDPTAISVEWALARAKNELPFEKAGQPDIRELPEPIVAQLLPFSQTQRFVELVGSNSWAFKLVEIDPLLAFQFQIDTSRAEELCRALASGVTIKQLADICLPTQLEPIPYQLAGLENGVVIRTKSLNLRLLRAGTIGDDPTTGSYTAGTELGPGRCVRDVVIGSRAQAHFAGIGFGPGVRLIQVARFDGKCYLRNGFHRAYGLRAAGATHMPCLLIDMPSFGEVGATGLPSTFGEALLRSANPPTLGHFTQGRAHPVQLRAMSRIIQVTWSECILPDE